MKSLTPHHTQSQPVMSIGTHDNTTNSDPEFTLNNPTNCHLLPHNDCNAVGECIGQAAAQSQSSPNEPDAIIHDTSEQECLHDQSMARCIHSAFKATTSGVWACVASPSHAWHAHAPAPAGAGAGQLCIRVAVHGARAWHAPRAATHGHTPDQDRA